MRRPILRDISFYLGALLLLVLVANWDGEMPLWQPLAFLLLYLLYAITVVSGNLYYQRTSQKTTRRSKLHRAIARLVPKKVAPTDFESEGKKVGELILTAAEEKAAAQKSTKNADNILHLPGGILVIPITEEDAHLRRALDCLEAGKFFGKEELDAEQSYAAEDNESMSPLPLMHMHGGISRVASPFPDASVFGEQMRLFWCLLAPLDTTKFRNSTWPGRIYRIAKVICSGHIF
jgi:Ca2+/Na+ antiporter